VKEKTKATPQWHV